MSTLEEHPTASQDAPVPSRTQQRVIVGVDDSPASMHATQWAAAEAANRQVPLHIVHTWTWQHLAPWLTATDRMVMGDLERAGHRLVSHCRTLALRERGLEITTEVRSGHAAEVLVEIARDAGLMVVGTHHLRPTAWVLLGSASSALVAQSTCPTVVVSGAPRADTGTRIVAGLSATRDDQTVLRFAFDHAARHGLALRALFAGTPISSRRSTCRSRSNRARGCPSHWPDGASSTRTSASTRRCGAFTRSPGSSTRPASTTCSSSVAGPTARD